MSVNATYHGFVGDTRDALLLFQAVLDRQLKDVERRPHDKEKGELIQSGSVFIFNESTSGIKRWTDNMNWSPSRILGNFLLYREKDGRAEDTKKPVSKRPGSNGSFSAASGSKKSQALYGGPYDRSPGPNPTSQELYGGGYGCDYGTTVHRSSISSMSSVNAPNGQRTSLASSNGSELGSSSERALVGSLVNSPQFKEGGLMKKTISITFAGKPYHLVSYYRPEDVQQNKLIRPQDDPLVNKNSISDTLINQSFRVALDPITATEQLNGNNIPGYPGLSINSTPGVGFSAYGPQVSAIQGLSIGSNMSSSMPMTVHSGYTMQPSQQQLQSLQSQSQMQMPSHSMPQHSSVQSQQQPHQINRLNRLGSLNLGSSTGTNQYHQYTADPRSFNATQSGVTYPSAGNGNQRFDSQGMYYSSSTGLAKSPTSNYTAMFGNSPAQPTAATYQSQNYVSRYKPFGSNNLPIPTDPQYNSIKVEDPYQRMGQQQPQQQRQQPDMSPKSEYQYDQQQQSRRSSIGAEDSPSLPPVSQDQQPPSNQYQIYAQELSPTSLSNPREMPWPANTGGAGAGSTTAPTQGSVLGSTNNKYTGLPVGATGHSRASTQSAQMGTGAPPSSSSANSIGSRPQSNAAATLSTRTSVDNSMGASAASSGDQYATVTSTAVTPNANASPTLATGHGSSGTTGQPVAQSPHAMYPYSIGQWP